MANIPGHANVNGSINKVVLDNHEEHSNIVLGKVILTLLLVFLKGRAILFSQVLLKIMKMKVFN